MRTYRRIIGLALAATIASTGLATAQERLPWERPADQGGYGSAVGQGQGGYGQGWGGPSSSPPPATTGYERQTERQSYGSPGSRVGASDAYRPPQQTYGGTPGGGYGAPPYGAPPAGAPEPYERSYGAPPPSPRAGYGAPSYADDEAQRGYYSQNEIVNAGHSFFGSVSKGLASAIEWTFQRSGRPNGYILGEDAGGAFVAGLRYGEGLLHTKDAGRHKVYWQGPSIGYDVGAEGSKTMVLVYNLRDPAEIYARFGGVQGAAYLVGGVSVQLQKHDDVVLAVIRSGLGLRLGANVGYLKYTRHATWNPF